MKFYSTFKRHLTTIILVAALGMLTLAWSVMSYAEDAANTTDWPRWRGPNLDGISTETGWLSTWPKEGPKQLWKRSVGLGYSSISVSDGRVYTMGNKKNIDTVYCLDANTGNVIWKYSYQCQQGSWKGTRVTPTVDGNRVYTLSRGGHLFCFDAVSGSVIWSKNLKKEMNAKSANHGFACHPLIVGKMLISEVGAKNGSIVVFDKTDGSVIWQKGSDKVGYSTPMPYSNVIASTSHSLSTGSAKQSNGKNCLAVFTGTAIVGMDISNGGQLWRHKWLTPYQCNIATPIISGDKIFISSGYGMGCALLQISQHNKPEIIWKNKKMANHFNSCVLWKGYLYGFHGAPKHNKDKGELRCLDFETGDVKWTQKGLGKGSLMIADGKLIVLSEKGQLVIAEASPDSFKEIARAKVLGGTCWTVPVLSGGKIYCRNHEGDLVCLDVSGLTIGPERSRRIDD